jgi:hypothetical protein
MSNSTETIIYDDDTYIIGPELDTILAIKLFASALSLLGSSFMLVSYLYFKIKTRNKQNTNNNNLKMGYGHDLIFFLALSDFIHAISAFVKTGGFMSQEADSNCIAQGILMNIGEVSSICWTTIISLSLYLGTIVLDFQKLRKWYFFLYTFTFTAIFTIGPFITHSYGQAGVWCWLNTKNLNNYSAWVWSLTIYIFHWCNIIFNIFAVYKTIRYFNIRAFEVKEDDKQQANFLKNFCIMLKFFPIILIICWVPATINRIYLFASKRENAFLYGFHAFFTSLIGFLDAIVYSYYYRGLLKTCCGCSEVKTHEEAERSKIEMGDGNAKNDNNEYIKNMTDVDIEVKNI